MLMTTSENQLVHCVYCGKGIKKSDEGIIQISNSRWCHKKCYDEFHAHRIRNLSEEEKRETDMNTLRQYIHEAFKGMNPNWPVIGREIKQFQQMGFSLSGIHKTLIYLFEVKQIDRFRLGGHINVVARYYQEAKSYYQKIYVNNKNALDNYKQESEQIKILEPQPIRNIKMLDIDSFEEGDN